MGGELWKTISREHNKGNSKFYGSTDTEIIIEYEEKLIK